MSIPTKIVHSLQVACCLSILLLLVHAGAREGADYYGGSPTITTLLLITSAHLLMSGCLLVAECTSSSNIYESPLVYLQTPLFFVLLVLSGAASILEVKRLESQEEKEIGVAGGIAIFAAVSSVFGCYTNVDGCNNVKIFSPPENCDSP
ncbi:uncharacterized protein TNIN_59081 [Trichonephila inaurata madagascariensis]|uniref:Uncharacterized protein n=1 Tax=Trichonephila inaurata madagascariensis TaxID=2747483 RepID=A0A8X7CRR8_9ARAC|nr:uncharacterized protein TNIN_59081 [Trichonephila inaurata madagascariensis]